MLDKKHEVSSLGGAPAKPSAAGAPPQQLEFTASKGVVLKADAWGDPRKQSVILMHGGGQTRHAWRGTAKALAEAGFYAVALDMRGHGESGWCPEADYSITTYADDLQAVAAHCSTRPALVGASLGGLTAMVSEGGSDNPVSSAVVLVDITPRMEMEGLQRIHAFMSASPGGFASIDDAADAVAEYLPHRPRPSDTSGLAKNLRLGPDGRYYWHWDPKFMTGRHFSEPSFPELIRESARNLKVPVLLVRGRMSEIVSSECVDDFLQLVPHAEYVDVADAAHMVAGDKNDAFCGAVVEFLSRKLASQSGLPSI